MTVRFAYLRFVAEIKGVPRKRSRGRDRAASPPKHRLAQVQAREIFQGTAAARPFGSSGFS